MEYRRSGLSAGDFSRQRGVSRKTLNYWVGRATALAQAAVTPPTGVIISGSRSIADRSNLELAIVRSGFAITEVITTDASGKDVSAIAGANDHHLPVKVQLLIIDELGFVPLTKTGVELLFEVFSQRHERGSTLVTSNLPFDEWTEIFGSQRLTGALLDRLTHHVPLLTEYMP